MNYEDYYTWQEDVPGFGEAAQEKLRQCTAMVSRVGGLGGPLALSLAAAGVGRIILAHGGELRPDDLNRQILMTHAGLGELRHVQARKLYEDLIRTSKSSQWVRISRRRMSRVSWERLILSFRVPLCLRNAS